MDPTVAEPTMPQMPEAPPDPFGGLVQAIALGFAAGFGGKSVQDQIAETRRQSWEAWMRKQDVALRREEMDRRDRQFAVSVQLQQAQLEMTRAAEERAAARAEASDKAAQTRFDMSFKAEREDKAKAEAERTRSEAGLAQVGVQSGLLPFDTLFATPQMLEAASRAQSDQAAQGRFEAEQLARADFQAEARKSEENKLAFDVWRTLRSENADVRNLDSQFRAQAVQLAHNDVANGRTNSFEGSVEEYLKLFGRASAAAKGGSVDMREALDAVKTGDFSRLDELRTAADVAAPRQAGTLTPIGGSFDGSGARVSPPPTPRSGILAAEVEARTNAQGAARQKAARAFLTGLPTRDLREIKDAFERNGGDSSDDASVLAFVASAMDTVGNDPRYRGAFGRGWSLEDIASGKATAVMARDYGDGLAPSYAPTPLSEKVVEFLKKDAVKAGPSSRPSSPDSRPSAAFQPVGSSESRPSQRPDSRPSLRLDRQAESGRGDSEYDAAVRARREDDAAKDFVWESATKAIYELKQIEASSSAREAKRAKSQERVAAIVDGLVEGIDERTRAAKIEKAKASVRRAMDAVKQMGTDAFDRLRINVAYDKAKALDRPYAPRRVPLTKSDYLDFLDKMQRSLIEAASASRRTK